MSPTEWKYLFESGGPWAVVAVLAVVVGLLTKYIAKLVDERDQREQARNAELLEILEKRIETDVKHEQAFNHMVKTFERVMDRL